MGSDWGEFCEANGWNPGSKEDHEKFLESLEDGRPSGGGPNHMSDYQCFDTYEEAVKWAKATPGRSIKRAENSQGFEVTPLSHQEHFPLARSAVRRSFQKFPDQGNAIWSYQYRSNEILQLAPHLHDVLTKSASNSWRISMRPFSRSKWEQEVRRLSNDQLQRLHLLIAVHLEDSRENLLGIYAEIKKRRDMEPGQYGEALSEKLHTFMECALADIDRLSIE